MDHRSMFHVKHELRHSASTEVPHLSAIARQKQSRDFWPHQIEVQISGEQVNDVELDLGAGEWRMFHVKHHGENSLEYWVARRDQPRQQSPWLLAYSVKDGKERALTRDADSTGVTSFSLGHLLEGDKMPIRLHWCGARKAE